MNSENNRSEFDEIGQQLHGQAMAERPAFSAEVHDRIMRGIRHSPNSKRVNRNGLLATAAAIILLSAMISIRWLIPSHHQELLVENVPDHSTPLSVVSPLPDQPIRLTVDMEGLFSVKISPLGVSMTSPILSYDAIPIEQHPVTAASEPIGSPEWLLTRLQEPASLAQATLTDLIPPDIQRLIRQASVNQ